MDARLKDRQKISELEKRAELLEEYLLRAMLSLINNNAGHELVREIRNDSRLKVALLKTIIEIFTDEGDIVIDPVAGSGSSLVAALELNRKAYGFEIKKNFYMSAKKWIEESLQTKQDIEKYGFKKTEMEKEQPILFSGV